jgi:glycosyltransferase involved in cell wall biosynthesis
VREKHRVLVLTSTYPRWRDDTLPPFVHELARRLAAEFEVHVLAPHARGATRHERLDGVEVHRFRYLPARFETLAYSGGMLPGLRRRPWRLLALPLFLGAEFVAALRLLRRQRFALIHAHWLLPHGLLAVMAARLCGYRPRILSTSHGADLYGLNGRVAHWLKQATAARCDQITVVSRAMRDVLAAQTGAGARCAVLPMGVDTRAQFVPAGEARDPRTLLFVGRLAEKKGLQVALGALALLPGEVRLRIIGGGAEEPRLRVRAAESALAGRVDFLGPKPNRELPRWFRQSSIVVFPSVVAAGGDQEGLGLVPVEALACGCAVVASDLPAIRDVIQHEHTGLLIRPGDPQELAAAVLRLLEDTGLRQRLAGEGRRYVVTHFDWEHIAREYAKIYRALATAH